MDMVGNLRFWRRLIVPVAVILVLTLAFRILFPTERVRDAVVLQIEQATGADVVMGDASLRFGLGIGVTLRGGSIRGTGRALAAATGSDNSLESYAVDLEDLEVNLALRPLVRRRIEVTSARLRGPALSFAWDGGKTEFAGYDLLLKHLAMGVTARTAPANSTIGDTPPGERIPADLEFDLAVSADSVVAERAVYRDVLVRGRFAERAFVADEVFARQGTGELAGNITVDYATDPWGRLDFTARVRAVPAAVLLEPWWASLAEKLEGDLDANISGGCGMRDSLTVARTLAVAGKVISDPGVIHARDWLQEVSPYLGRRQDLLDVRFESIRHVFRLENGRYSFEETAITGGETEWFGRGWVDLGGNVEVNVKVRLPAGFTPDLGSWSFLAEGLRDDAGRVSLAFKLTGPASRPDLGLDLQGTVRGGR